MAVRLLILMESMAVTGFDWTSQMARSSLVAAEECVRLIDGYRLID
jgi:hypothetical protein